MYDFTEKRRRYTTLGARDNIIIPFSVVEQLHEIGKHSKDIRRELGGCIRLDTMKVECEEGLKGTGAASFIPSKKLLAKKNVVRFHCHPLDSFETPPSYQDLVQLCKDYVQHHDGIIEHIVVTPKGFFLMCIPPKILFHLNEFVASLCSKDKISGKRRKALFLESPLFSQLETFCKKIKKYQECRVYDLGCVQEFIRNMKDNFGLQLKYKQFKKNLTLQICRFGAKRRTTRRKSSSRSRSR